MAAKPSISEAFRKAALRLPDSEEGVACAGTALESVTVKAGTKAFLFVRPTEARLKLVESRAEAAKLAAKDPAHYAIGATGWATIRFDAEHAPPRDLVERWVEESHRAVMGGAMTPARASAGAAKKRR